jgi:hypothetical protein
VFGRQCAPTIMSDRFRVVVVGCGCHCESLSALCAVTAQSDHARRADSRGGGADGKGEERRRESKAEMVWP